MDLPGVAKGSRATGSSHCCSIREGNHGETHGVVLKGSGSTAKPFALHQGSWMACRKENTGNNAALEPRYGLIQILWLCLGFSDELNPN